MNTDLLERGERGREGQREGERDGGREREGERERIRTVNCWKGEREEKH